jgi:hypothetical protein
MEYNVNDHNADALVSLNASIKGAVTSFCRASAIYNRACVDGCFLEDVVLTKSYRQNNDGVITSNLRKQARSRMRLLWQKFEYYRYVVLWKVCRRVPQDAVFFGGKTTISFAVLYCASDICRLVLLIILFRAVHQHSNDVPHGAHVPHAHGLRAHSASSIERNNTHG